MKSVGAGEDVKFRLPHRYGEVGVRSKPEYCRIDIRIAGVGIRNIVISERTVVFETKRSAAVGRGCNLGIAPYCKVLDVNKSQPAVIHLINIGHVYSFAGGLVNGSERTSDEDSRSIVAQAK